MEWNGMEWNRMARWWCRGRSLKLKCPSTSTSSIPMCIAMPCAYNDTVGKHKAFLLWGGRWFLVCYMQVRGATVSCASRNIYIFVRALQFVVVNPSNENMNAYGSDWNAVKWRQAVPISMLSVHYCLTGVLYDRRLYMKASVMWRHDWRHFTAF